MYRDDASIQLPWVIISELDLIVCCWEFERYSAVRNGNRKCVFDLLPYVMLLFLAAGGWCNTLVGLCWWHFRPTITHPTNETTSRLLGATYNIDQTRASELVVSQYGTQVVISSVEFSIG